MTKNRTPTPVYLDPGMHPGLEVKGLRYVALVQWFKLPAWEVGHRGFEPLYGFQVSKEHIVFPRSLVKIQYCGETQ